MADSNGKGKSSKQRSKSRSRSRKSPLSQRQLAIESNIRLAVENWASGDLGLAEDRWELIHKFHHMSDKTFEELSRKHK